LALCVPTLAQSSLPKEVQADLLQKEIINGLEGGDLAAAKSSLAKYRALDIQMPLVLVLIEAKIAVSDNDYILAEKRLAEYLSQGGKAAPSYSEALNLYRDVSNKIEAEKAKQQVQEIAERKRISDTISGCMSGSTCWSQAKEYGPVGTPFARAITTGSLARGCDFGSAKACFASAYQLYWNYEGDYAADKMGGVFRGTKAKNKKLGRSHAIRACNADLDYCSKVLDELSINFDDASHLSILARLCFEKRLARRCAFVVYNGRRTFHSYAFKKEAIRFGRFGCYELNDADSCRHLAYTYRFRLNDERSAKKIRRRVKELQ
jgi:hypothetical protein